MSATILWKPVAAGLDLQAPVPSLFIQAMKRAGYHLPCKLGPSDVQTLHGIAAGIGGGHPVNPFTKLTELIEEHGPIDVWAEY